MTRGRQQPHLGRQVGDEIIQAGQERPVRQDVQIVDDEGEGVRQVLEDLVDE